MPSPRKLRKQHFRIAQRNLERCLRALDEHGEAGLQAELDRLYPGTSASPAPRFEKVPLGDEFQFPDSHCLRILPPLDREN